MYMYLSVYVSAYKYPESEIFIHLAFPKENKNDLFCIEI